MEEGIDKKYCILQQESLRMDKKYEEKFHIIVFYYVEDLGKYKNMNLNNLDEAANEDAKK